MAVRSFTCRFNGLVSYVDGSNKSFEGIWDGKRAYFPSGVDGYTDGAAAFNEAAAGTESIIDAMNDAISDPVNPSSGAVDFAYTTPDYPSDRDDVRDMVLNLCGTVAYDDGSNGSFEVVYQLTRASASTITNENLINILADATAGSQLNSLLTDTVGFTLTLS